MVREGSGGIASEHDVARVVSQGDGGRMEAAGGGRAEGGK